MFGNNTEMAKELINIMIDIDKSKLIMGEVQKPKKSFTKD